ncbi:MAG: conjugal transfer protein TrbC [Methyloglobulus sp.]|nr:conjugal transfer protein TrbC [Methyloglobulus sp.]
MQMTQNQAHNKQILSTIGQALLLAVFILLPALAIASTGTGGSLPYEPWLTSLANSVTGPVAFTLSVVGIVVAGGTLILGGELNAFFRTMIFLVLVMALLVGAQNIMSGLFGRGAVIAAFEGAKIQSANAAILATERIG